MKFGCFEYLNEEKEYKMGLISRDQREYRDEAI